MLTIFNRCHLAVVDNNEDLFAIRQALSGAGIPCKVKVDEQFNNSHNRGAGIAALAGEKYRYIIYIKKQDYERAKACISR
jgi:hypothetical protein